MNDLKIGELLQSPAHAHRDAIHIAVIPAIASQKLMAGEWVALAKPPTAEDEPVKIRSLTAGEKAVGIVDPYLTEAVRKNKGCWLFLFPGTVTALRHAWEHPDFRVPIPLNVPAPAAEPLPVPLSPIDRAKTRAEGYLRILFDKFMGESPEKYDETDWEGPKTFEEFLEAMQTYVRSNGHDSTYLNWDTPYEIFDDKMWDMFTVYTGIPVPDDMRSDQPFRCSC